LGGDKKRPGPANRHRRQTLRPDPDRIPNTGPAAVVWKAGFSGGWDTIIVGDAAQKTELAKDEAGAVFSFVRLKVEPGRTVSAAAGHKT